VLQSSGDAANAEREFARAEEARVEAARAQEASVLTAAGTQQLERGELRPALALFEKATAVLDSYAPAFYQMGRTRAALGESALAREAFARAQRLNPNLTPPRNSP
jgi:tetratricopeptide (TPR) repeat protein